MWVIIIAIHAAVLPKALRRARKTPWGIIPTLHPKTPRNVTLLHATPNYAKQTKQCADYPRYSCMWLKFSHNSSFQLRTSTFSRGTAAAGRTARFAGHFFRGSTYSSYSLSPQASDKGDRERTLVLPVSEVMR